MKCPWCKREIGFPAPNITSAYCPYCNGKYSYAFKLGEYLIGLSIGTIAAWILKPYLGEIIIPIALAAPLFYSMYLSKRY